MKNLAFVQRSQGSYWVDDGFPVRNLFSYNDIAQELSPFLKLDYAGPTQFGPTAQRRGVGPHPPPGFETVTIVYDGGVSHRDSSGGGGPFELVQLWVNLPARRKMAAPAYQPITADQIPTVPLPGAGSARLIAGECQGVQGPFVMNSREEIVQAIHDFQTGRFGPLD
ncbi:MAG: pirin family protein [Rhodoferax sp.]